MGRSGPGKCKQQMIAFPFNKLKANRSQVPPSVSYGTCPPTGCFCRLHRTNPTFPPAVLAACSQYTGLLSAPCDRYLHALFSRPCLLADITSASSSLSSRVNHHPLDVEAPPRDTPLHPEPTSLFPIAHLGVAALHLSVRLFSQYLSRRLLRGSTTSFCFCLSLWRPKLGPAGTIDAQ